MMESDIVDNPCRKRRREEKSFCNSLNASQYEEDLPGPLGEASTTIYQIPSTTTPSSSSSSSSSSQSKSHGVISPGSSFRDYYHHNLQSRVMMLENQLGTALEELHKLRDSFQCLQNTPQTQAHTSLSITPASSTSLQISLGSSNSSTTSTTLSAPIPTPPKANKGSEVVELDIGGTKFKTFRSTLCQNSSTMLARLFDPDSLFNLPREADGAVFIDRSPKHFPAILAYLRSGRMELPKNLEEIIEFEHECEFYGIPFPEDAFLKYPDCYTLEKVIHLPSSLPKVKEARKNFVMACADKGWGCGMINIFTGAYDETSNFPMSDLFREEPKGVFSRGFIVSDNGHPCVWFLDQHKCYLTILDLHTNDLSSIDLEGDSVEWEAYNYRSIGTKDVLILYKAASEKSIVKKFINLSTKSVATPSWGKSNGDERDFCMQTVQLDNILACLFKVESGQKNERYIMAWNTLTWDFAWERKAPSNTLFILACEDSILLIDENGAGYLLDPVRGSTVGIHHPIASQLEEACARKLKSSDRVCCFGR